MGEDFRGGWPFLRLVVPAPFRQFPDRWGQPKRFRRDRFGWPFAPRHHENDGRVQSVGIWNITGVQLTIRREREHLG